MGACLALQPVVKIPPGAHVKADPPVKPLQHVQRARGSKVARGRPMTSLHDPRAHEQKDVGTKRLVVQHASRSPHPVKRVRRRRRRTTDE